MEKVNINPKDVTLHLIGNAHLDPVWLWRWQEGFAETKATFRSALDRMNERPDFVFTCAAAAIYEWVEENAPEMFQEIRKRVQEGRWVIVGGWWIQPDCNIPSGESFVRQGLYSQRYFRAKLGKAAIIGYCVDSFGHAATLPKLLAGCGMKGYCWMRPGRHENDTIPWPNCWWETADGSRILSMRIMTAYTTWSVQDLTNHVQGTPKEHMQPPLLSDAMCFYGVGDHGGGPTKEQLAAVAEWRKNPSMPKLVYSSPNQFYEVAVQKAGDKFPVYRGELQHHASGCYAAVSMIKALNRRAEEMLLAAERWAGVTQMALGRPSPSEKLGRAWKHVLFNQFHDIMAGSSVDDAYNDARDQLGGAIHDASYLMNAAQQAISWAVNTQGQGDPVFIFNNQARPFEGVVETEDFGEEINATHAFFADASGKPLPAQEVDPHTRASRHRAVIYAALPSLGHKVLMLREGASPEAGTLLGDKAVRTGATDPAKGPWWMENNAIRAEIDGNGLLQIRDKAKGRDVFSAPAATPLVIEDKSDTWSHGVFRFDKVIDRFQKVSARLIETGPVRGGIRVKYRYADSLLTLDFLLGAGENHVEIRGEVDWRDAWKVVKITFPANVKTDRCTVEIPYGTIVRPTDGEEEPMLQWVGVSDAQGGLTVANNGKYSHCVQGSEIRITLLRSPAYAFHDPFKVDYQGDNRIIDRGIQHFRLSVIPHGGDWRAADVIGKARRLNFPATVLFETNHPGTLPLEMTGAVCDSPGVEISAIKGAEDGKGLIVRACEWFGRQTEARFELPPAKRAWKATFTPTQVKTFFVPEDASQPVREVNMLEE